jgi:hypothetical protein
VERVLHADEDDPRQVEQGDDHRGDDDADWNSPATTPQVPSNASRRATVRWIAGSSSTDEHAPGPPPDGDQ